VRAELLTRIGNESKCIPYQGTYESDRQYLPGQFCTYNGSVWHASVVTRQSPGNGSGDWTLAVKHGKDAR
jgi:hypothetical protein